MFFAPPASASTSGSGSYRTLLTPVGATAKTAYGSQLSSENPMSIGAVPAVPGSFDYPASFLNDLSRAIQKNTEEGAVGALFIVSVNNLAMIMNAYGHDGAERVMAQLCELLRAYVKPGDIAERLGRDQIGVIVHACDKEGMTQLARQFHRLIQDYGSTSPVGALHVTSSIGSVDFPVQVNSAIDAIDKAYIALHSTYGISYRTYDETRDEGILCRQQMGLANYLRRAIHENRLRLAFQPIIEAKTGSISHYEALLRIIGEDGKISSAGALIPVAERMGLIDMIDHLVFDMVVKELQSSPNVTLSFNVSNITTDNPHWLEHATSTLRKHPEIASRMAAAGVALNLATGQPDPALIEAAVRHVFASPEIAGAARGIGAALKNLDAIAVIEAAFSRPPMSDAA